MAIEPIDDLVHYISHDKVPYKQSPIPPFQKNKSMPILHDMPCLTSVDS